MSTIKELLLILTLIALSAVLGASLYQSVVDAPNFNANIPDSLEHFRQFMSVTNPGNYFRVVAPAAQILVLLSLILGWTSSRRWWLIAALTFVVGADVITFTIHYPRNALMFTAPMSVPVDALKQAAAEWLVWNHVRTVLVLASMVSTIKALVGKNDRVIQ